MSYKDPLSGPVKVSVSPTVHRTLKLSVLDGFLHSLMVGFGETYLPAYVLAIGMNEIFAGVLSCLPMISGAFIQLFSPKGLQKIGSHKSWVVGTTALQAVSFLPLIYFSSTHAPDFWTLFAVLTLYWAANFATGPAWNYWMGHLVPPTIAAEYFSKRNRVAQVGLLIGVVGGGVCLHNRVELLPFTSVFGMIFVFGFLARMTSSFLLSAHHFQRDWSHQQRLLGVKESLQLFLNTGVKRKFFLYFLPLQIAIYISSPFVAPYLLAQVKLDYGGFMGSVAFLLIGKIITLTLIQRRQEKVNPFKIFGIGLVAICPSPLLWSLSDSYSFILLLQLTAGMAWACVEVGLALIFFHDLNHEEKVPILTVYNLLNAAGIIIGTAIGGQWLSMMGLSKSSYHLVFAIGGMIRFVFAAALLKVVKEWKDIEEAAESSAQVKSTQKAL